MKHKITLFALGIAFIGIFTGTVLSSSASAADARNFNAGRIIDDAIFTNSVSMSPQDIQSFLNSKVACDTWGKKTSELGGGTRAQWMSARGISAPFRCSTDYYENPLTGQNNYSKNENPSGSISAAQIIYNYSKQFNINPQVIIATLQKENGMITDEWPTPKQFSESMGFGCPDNVAPGAPACDPSYGSFSAQIYQAARHFRGYLDNKPGWWIPFNLGNNQVMWNVSSTGCGSGNVFIENRATVALYSYTPYQPNNAAKNAQYGRGDGCSAYGNRNFYLYFTDWFGSTLTPTYAWRNNGYKVMTQDGSQQVDPGQLLPGEKYSVILSATNIGSTAWKNNNSTPVRLAVVGGNSDLCTDGWITCDRPVNLHEGNVDPGQTGTFKFLIRVPYTAGTYRQSFKPLAESLAWMNDSNESLGIVVKDPGTYTWRNNGYKVMTQDGSQQVDPGQLLPGEKYTAVLSALNTGTATWKNNGATPVRLGSVGGNNPFCSASWLSCDRPVSLTESSVTPGQIGSFRFEFQAPYAAGSYRQAFKPVAEFLTWMNDTGESLGIVVKDTGTYTWRNNGYKVMTQDGSQFVDPGQLVAGEKYLAILSAINTGSATWKNNNPTPVRLASTTGNSPLCTTTWIACDRPVSLTESSIAPGQTGSFRFVFQAPTTPGTYRATFKPVSEFLTWMNDSNEPLGIIVKS